MFKIRTILIFLAAMATMAPTLSGWYSLVLILIVLVGGLLTKNCGFKVYIPFFVIFTIVIGLGLSGVLSVELLTVLLACGLIMTFFPQFVPIAVAFVFIETPLFQAVALFVGANLPLQIEQAAPVITCFFLSTLIFKHVIKKVVIFTFLVLCSSLINWWLNIDVLFVGLENSVLFGVFFASINRVEISYPKIKFYLVVGILLIHSIFIWSCSTRFDMNRIVVWLPISLDKYESQFFKDYSHTLNLSGIKVKQVSDVGEIEANSLVIVPWGTDIQAHQFLMDLKKSKIGNTLTVLVGGEHTNYSGFADRLNPLLNGALRFNNTTTVPPLNANQMGALWTSSIMQFPFNATINRGASLTLSSMRVFPILIAKSIFSDIGPNEFNDFWVGDFLLGHFDPRGWTLLMAACKDGPLWVLSGDNSFLMNRYLLPNPQPITQAISLASLYPLLILQLWLLVIMMSLGFQATKFLDPSIKIKFAIILIVLSFGTLGLTPSLQKATNILMSNLVLIEPQYFGGDERSSSVAIAANSKAINESKKKLFVHEGGFTSKNVGNSHHEEIHIGHIKNIFQYNGVTIDNCNLTSYINKVDPKVNLLEAQYCRVSGDAKIIVGDKYQASVIQIKSEPPVTLILDKYFLAGSPPFDSNVEFLLKKLADPISE